MLGKIVSPRLEKLEKEFLESGGEWHEYKVEDLFYVTTGKQPNIKNRFDIKEKGMVNTITGATSNNGICFYSFSEEAIINELTIAKDGEYAGTVFLQTEEFIIGGHCLGILSKNKMSNKSKLYIAGLINKVREIWKGYDRPTVPKTKLEQLKLNLPFKNGKINFSYMEKFIEELEVLRIEELEALRIEELEAYLVATGLKDYKLTKEDQKILDDFEKMSDNSLDRQTDKIRLEDILDWQTSIKELNPLHLDKLSCNGAKYPFYGQATDNNGIISYESLKAEVLNNKNSLSTILIHSNNQNIVYLETPFYLKDGHGATSVLQNKKMNKHSALYLMGAIQKVIKERFNYNAKATKIGLKNTIIEVPMADSEIDFRFMEDFINVVEKLVIKDVVIWADKKIEATKQVVLKH